LFFLRVKGDSMTPRLEEGDLVLVRSQSHGDPGDVVVALSGEEATVKQLLVKNGKFILHPLNGAYKDIKPDEGFAINGKVVGLIRRI
jgi:repressor LexA